ncbi:hypothetical protein CHS0354_012895 [Potamilus streckersoni]|uniref:Tubulin--tyrosine ligase-like protein 12 SET-like domain-containing protein n=1 Tax=Potamilus streckersoni TaxID=2493646 RepID=A0AAE0SAU8_9BIVA|nr:hypothetical protein CHS0354_012895 [Potamilus streckersoni]
MQAEEDKDVSDFVQFVATHGLQLRNSGVPELYWNALYYKLKEEIFDAGDTFQMVVEESEDEETPTKWHVLVTVEDGIQCQDPTHIYLIDHAWTYRVRDAWVQLKGMPRLLERMSALMGVASEGKEQDEIITGVMDEMWKYNQTYSLGHISKEYEEAQPIWYIMDEFGSRIQHSDTPTFKTAPFYYTPSQLTFTLLWPVLALEKGDEVTRDFVSGTTDPDLRAARLIPWRPIDMTSISYTQEEPELSYFTSHKVDETLPDLSQDFPGLPRDRNVKVYTDNQMFAKHLTDPRFELVSTEEEADILWLLTHLKDYRSLSEENPGKLVNQFPCECVVTVKDILAAVSRRAGSGKVDPDSMETEPKWLATTYNLQTELPKFVSYFQHRKKKGLDNHWICKPWNLARGMDMHIANNLNYILRLPDTGPKIACKYVEDPVLFYREDVGGSVKFDLRYVVLLSSVQPLKLYVDKVFWLRFANRPYSLENLDVYEKHFTVMNYVEGGKNLKQIHYYEFIPMFESQYPGYSWSEVEESIFQMIRGIFEAASAKPAPAGIGHSPQSRAMYAIDLLLRWDKNNKGNRVIQPVLCEVNFGPDCERACRYYPDFVNNLFSVLFLDDVDGRPYTPL